MEGTTHEYLISAFKFLFFSCITWCTQLVPICCVQTPFGRANPNRILELMVFFSQALLIRVAHFQLKFSVPDFLLGFVRSSSVFARRCSQLRQHIGHLITRGDTRTAFNTQLQELTVGVSCLSINSNPFFSLPRRRFLRRSYHSVAGDQSTSSFQTTYFHRLSFKCMNGKFK